MEIIETTKTVKRSWLYPLVLLFFFLSGMTGLIYEILWTRMITGIIGAAPFAVSIVLTVFMGGLGLGSYIAGRRIDGIAGPGRLLRLYGILELTIGMYGLALPHLLTFMRPMYVFAYNRLFDQFFLYNLLTFAGCSLLLVAPVICMGATLPLLSRFYVTSMEHVGSHLGRLYGINTIGAAAGSLICGFWLIAHAGIPGSLMIAVWINAIIGACCYIIGSRMKKAASLSTGSETVSARREPVEEVSAGSFPFVPALVIFAVSGFCSMSYEVIWTKLLALIVGPTTYSFTVVLVTFITGLALGSIVFGWMADRHENSYMLLVFTQAAAAVSALVISQLMGNSQIFFGKLIYSFRNHFAQLMLLKSAVLFALMFMPTFFLGATFPLVCRIYTRSLGSIGKSVGSAYAINTIGAVLGSFCAGFLLIPLFGKEASIRLLVSVQLFAALAVAKVTYEKARAKLANYVIFTLLIFVGFGLLFSFPRWNRAVLSVGKYHRSFDEPERWKLGWFDSLFIGTRLFSYFDVGKIVYFGDGIGGFTTVKRHADVAGKTGYSLFNSGKSDASTGGGDMCTQTLLGHFPMLFHPKPDDVLVIGLASGITAGEILHYAVRRLDVVDINKQVIEASDFFRPWNNNVLDDPRTSLIVQDGRAHLQLTRRTYDVIISEPSNPWMAGLATLFTREFFTLAKDRLKENGIYVQWLQGYQIDWENFSLIGRTFADVFPNSVLVETGNSVDYLLVGFKGKGGIDALTAAGNLKYAQRSHIVTIPDHRIVYRLIVNEELQRFFGGGWINTDEYPLLEFSAPRLMNATDPIIYFNTSTKKWLSGATEEITRSIITNVDAQIDFVAYMLSFDDMFGNCGEIVDLKRATPEQRERYTNILEGFCANNLVEYYSFIKDKEIRTLCMKSQIEGLKNRIEASPDKIDLLFHLGELSYETVQLDKALIFYTEALSINPKRPLVNHNIGIVLTAQGKLDEAIPYFRDEIQLNPLYLSSYNSLGNVLVLTGKQEEAVEWYRKALDIDSEYSKAHANLGVILKKLGKTEEGERHLREAERLKGESEKQDQSTRP